MEAHAIMLAHNSGMGPGARTIPWRRPRPWLRIWAGPPIQAFAQTHVDQVPKNEVFWSSGKDHQKANFRILRIRIRNFRILQIRPLILIRKCKIIFSNPRIQIFEFFESGFENFEFFESGFSNSSNPDSKIWGSSKGCFWGAVVSPS